MSEAAARYGALCRAELRLEYLHANSTTHDFLFGAVAELIDNSRDAGATRLDIFTVTNENLQGGFMLCFLDNGCGMNPREATDLVYFGRSSKRLVANMIGHYGNGLKSGSMRIGKDFILFTKKGETMTCLLFSQSFCEKEGLLEVIVPIPSWSSSTRSPLTDDPEKFATQLSIICKYSPFTNEAALMDQFAFISGESGTLVILYNLKLTLSGEPELDNQTDEVDILIAESPESLPEQRSLRAYIAILYFDPRMQIFIQAQKVETKRLPYCFYRPRMYPYISSSFKEVAMNELRKAEMDVKAAEDIVKEAKGRLKHLQDSFLHVNTEDALQAAVENEKRMRHNLEDKQRNLRRPKKLFLIFGINIQNRSQDGMLIYSNSRLIRMFEKVGPQKKKDSYCGAGAVGMVDVPLGIMEPTHNKQAFANVKEYNHLMKSMGLHLVQYWKDVGISKRGETFFWNDFGYLSNRWYEKPSDTIQYKRRRAVEIPDIVQCDHCLKWRLLSFDTDINNEGHHGAWNCEKNPNRLENKCDIPEHLPSIPLGVFKPPSLSLNANQQLLIDSIQQRKRKMENLQSQRVQLIQPHRIIHCPPATKNNKTAENTVCLRKALHEDPSLACRRLIKSGTNNKPRQHSSCKVQLPAKKRGHPRKKQQPCEEEECSLSVLEDGKDDNLSEVLSFEIKDEQPYNEEDEVIKIETDSEPEVIYVIISDSEAEDLPKHNECGDYAFRHKEEQEPFDGNGDSHFSLVGCVRFEEQVLPPVDLESGFAEASQEDNKEHVHVSVQDSRTVVSHAQETSQIISDSKMVELLTSHIREILLNFLPLCSLSREEIICMSPEDILTMFKLKEHSEQHKTETLYIDQYYSQYEEQLLGKLQYVRQQNLHTIHATETKISLCETQIKAAEEKLEYLRGTIAQLLLKQNPHLLINNLEDVDSYLEQHLQHQENLGTSCMNTDSTAFCKSSLLGEESGTSFSPV
ncbi:MORC family CW-type zinc finger protein 1 [Tiliqua scincoides]|uniref:MORC family CW-type zinc finger protein 1 n=1 Tax=Tiliqua scincoides TaxID=71010 RepID=UPI0034628DB6